MNTTSAVELSLWKKNGSPLQIIDVRSPDEYRAGHIPGALNIPLESVVGSLEDLSASAPIVLVCQSGTRATMACERLIPYRSNISVLEGGTAVWIQCGKAVVRQQASSWSLERQVRFVAGLIVLSGTIGSLFWKPALFFAMFIGAGLLFASITNWCGMAMLLAKMPWNKANNTHINRPQAIATE